MYVDLIKLYDFDVELIVCLHSIKFPKKMEIYYKSVQNTIPN